MAKTGVRSAQVKDGEITRIDLNAVDSGKAVARKIIAPPTILFPPAARFPVKAIDPSLLRNSRPSANLVVTIPASLLTFALVIVSSEIWLPPCNTVAAIYYSP